MNRVLTKPELCQVCATGHDRVHCIYAPVPCEDRIGLWEAGEAEGRRQAARTVDNIRRTLSYEGPGQVTEFARHVIDEMFTYAAKRIREGV
jgi:hypothetical protein